MGIKTGHLQCPNVVLKGLKMKTGNLVTVKEMAQRLSVPESWIYQRTRLGQKAIPHLRLGKYIRFDAAPSRH